MNIAEQREGANELCHSVTVQGDELETLVKDALDNLRKRVKVKGFRPGKAPDSIIKNLYGDEVLRTVLDKILKDATGMVLEKLDESEEKTLFGPTIEEFSGDINNLSSFLKSVEEKGKLEIRFVTELRPKIEKVEGYKDIELEREEIKVEDSEIDDAVKTVLGRFSQFEDVDPPRPIVEEDAVTISGRVEKEGEIIQELENFSFMVGRELFLKDVEGSVDTREFLGKSLGEMIDVPFVKDGKKTGFILKAMVKDIKERKIPELNQDILDKLGMKDEEELREKLKERILDDKKRRERERLREKVKKILLEKNPVEIPKRFLSNYTEKILRDRLGLLVSMGVPEEKAREELSKRMDDIKKEAEDDLAFALILERIAELEGIEVDDEEVIKRMEERSGGGITEEAIRNYLSSNPERMKEMKAVIMGEKVLDLILGEVG